MQPARASSGPSRLPASVLLAVAAGLAACSSSPGTSLVGDWQGEGEAGTGTSLTLRDDGTALWVLDPAAPSGSFEIRYAVDASHEPLHLDLFGFDRGALEGLTLYGIADVTDGRRLRFDCEPAPAGGDGNAVRPTTFTDETITYTRSR